jgi:hypothetical protein
MRYVPITGVSEHHVQLFDSSKSLAETVSGFLMSGFERGEPLLIVARPYHRQLLIERLESRGLNVRNAVIANRVVILDAQEMMDKFMRHDTPNAAAFDEVVGTLVARLANGGRVCIYGEMVDLLADQGKYKSAHQLEELWNALGRRECYTLFCGYASGHFGDPRTAKMLGAICESHSHLHRDSGDLLAEFLLDQPDVKAALDTSASRS